MARLRKKIKKIGIVGCDSFHTPILLEKFKLMDTIEVQWIDITPRSKIESAHTRQEKFEMRCDQSLLKTIDLEDHEPVDAYCVLTMDASQHLNIVKKLNTTKPIFVDKPIALDMDSILSMASYNIHSSSGIRYCDFIKDIHQPDTLEIEGPLSFMEGVPGYFWYGIHLIELLQAITKESIEIENIDIHDTYELITGTSGNTRFTIRAIKEGDPDYLIKINDDIRTLKSYDHLYQRLAERIVAFFYGEKTYLNDTIKVIQTIITINTLRSMQNESSNI